TEIANLWTSVKRDPKLLEFVDRLKSNQTLKKNKLIVFTESRETAEYLAQNIDRAFPGQVLTYSGASGAPARQEVEANFDARAKHPEDDYRILVSTEVLSEGVNLHRSNVVINYDIPWNPTRMIQRVGRINRVDTRFDKIYTFNFFPTIQSNNEIKLKEAAEHKIQAFIEMLGADARLLTDGEEIKSHDLFSRLTSKKTITGEDNAEESELKYLQVIRDIRDNDPALFEHIKRLPRKARTGRLVKGKENRLLTYFRKGKLQKFYLTEGKPSAELDFVAAAHALETPPGTARENIPKDYYELLARNKQAFQGATTEVDLPGPALKGGRDSDSFVLKVLKSKQVRHCLTYTDDDEIY
ncbi:MAG: helicase-related protein, partial [bacterium]|nr:helicase-related protein [bacterium]